MIKVLLSGLFVFGATFLAFQPSSEAHGKKGDGKECNHKDGKCECGHKEGKECTCKHKEGKSCDEHVHDDAKKEETKH